MLYHLYHVQTCWFSFVSDFPLCWYHLVAQILPRKIPLLILINPRITNNELTKGVNTLCHPFMVSPWGCFIMFMMFTISVWIALYLVNLFILDYDSGIQAAPPSHQPTSPPAPPGIQTHSLSGQRSWWFAQRQADDDSPEKWAHGPMGTRWGPTALARLGF